MSFQIGEENWWRLRRLKLSGAAEVLGKAPVSVKPVLAREDLLEVLYLVHQRYVEVGIIDESSSLWTTPYHFLSETRFFATYLGNEGPLSVAAIVFDSPQGLPSDEIFSEELKNIRKRKRFLAEFFSLASLPKMKARNTLFYLFRMLYQYATFRGVTDIVIAIHPKHADFYERLLLFSRRGDRRKHPKFKGASFILEHLDLKKAKHRYYKVYKNFPPPFNLYHFFEKAQLPKKELFSAIVNAPSLGDILSIDDLKIRSKIRINSL